jgi:hypothetical protein
MTATALFRPALLLLAGLLLSCQATDEDPPRGEPAADRVGEVPVTGVGMNGGPGAFGGGRKPALPTAPGTGHYGGVNGGR